MKAPPTMEQDLEWSLDEDDAESFKSTRESELPLGESFLAYSSSYFIPPPVVDASIMEHFEDTHEDEDWDEEITEDDADGHGHGISIIEEVTTPSNPGGVVEHRQLKTEDVANRTNTIHPERKEGLAEDNEYKWKRVQQKDAPHRPEVNALHFNQDRDCVVISTSSGYRIRTLPRGSRHDDEQEHGDEKVQVFDKSIPNGGTTQIQILHSSSLIAIVKYSTPRILSLCHAQTARSLKELIFESAIRRVEMNLKSLVVLTADGVLHVYFFTVVNGRKDIIFLQRFSILHPTESARTITAKDASTSGALFSLSTHIFKTPTVDTEEAESWLVTKCADGVGMVSVFRTDYSCNKKAIKLAKSFSAHSQSISRIAIGGASSNSQQEKFIATCSIKGTVIRVFKLPTCEKLYELHRGTSPCTIFSMSFNHDSSYLALSSSKGTVHIFHLSDKVSTKHSGNKIFWSKNLSSQLYDFIGRFSTKSTLNQKEAVRSFARIRIKSEKIGKKVLPNTITFLEPVVEKEDEIESHVVVCTDNAKYFQFAVRGNGKTRPIRAEDMFF